MTDYFSQLESFDDEALASFAMPLGSGAASNYHHYVNATDDPETIQPGKAALTSPSGLH